jgi:hypothetical protein
VTHPFFRLPSRRRLAIYGAIVAVPALAWLLWSPGADVRDGRHDRGQNGLWMQHGWLGDDAWYARHTRPDKDQLKARLRDPGHLAETAAHLRRHGVRDLFPHLCPADPRGPIPPVDDAQTERFLDAFTPPDFRVLPWVGGVLDQHVHLRDPAWRGRFVASVVALIQAHPRLAGVHLNVEPCPSGTPEYLLLLEELRAALPQGKLLSVAAYPPPTALHRYEDVHWSSDYLAAVAQRSDQLAVMLYDTALSSRKVYTWLVGSWTGEVLAAAGATPVLLGLPAYDDAGVGYHDPEVENLETALAGVHAGLDDFAALPDAYQGVAIYCDWELTDDEWALLEERFLTPRATPR